MASRHPTKGTPYRGSLGVWCLDEVNPGLRPSICSRSTVYRNRLRPRRSRGRDRCHASLGPSRTGLDWPRLTSSRLASLDSVSLDQSRLGQSRPVSTSPDESRRVQTSPDQTSPDETSRVRTSRVRTSQDESGRVRKSRVRTRRSRVQTRRGRLTKQLVPNN